MITIIRDASQSDIQGWSTEGHRDKDRHYIQHEIESQMRKKVASRFCTTFSTTRRSSSLPCNALTFYPFSCTHFFDFHWTLIRSSFDRLTWKSRPRDAWCIHILQEIYRRSCTQKRTCCFSILVIPHPLLRHENWASTFYMHFPTSSFSPSLFSRLTDAHLHDGMFCAKLSIKLRITLYPWEKDVCSAIEVKNDNMSHHFPSLIMIMHLIPERLDFSPSFSQSQMSRQSRERTHSFAV